MTSTRSIPWLRLGTEFVVIVVGVLTALLLESWRGYMVERSLEAQYIEQIEADLKQNRDLLAEAISTERAHLALAEKVELAVYQVEPPDVDSLRAWLGQRREALWWYSDPRLLDGTMTALVETGDLALVRDPSLRSSVLSYLGQLRADSEEFRRFIQRGMDASVVIADRGEVGLAPGIVPGEEREIMRILALRDDPQGRAAIEAHRHAYLNRVWYLDQMLTATEALIRTLESR